MKLLQMIWPTYPSNPILIVVKQISCKICQRSSDPFYLYSKLLNKTSNFVSICVIFIWNNPVGNTLSPMMSAILFLNQFYETIDEQTQCDYHIGDDEHGQHYSITTMRIWHYLNHYPFLLTNVSFSAWKARGEWKATS